MPKVYTNTFTFTKARTEVIRDQFELFLRYTGMKSSDRESLLASVERGELAAVGAYLENDGYRVAELELEVDWDLHALLKRAEGDMFDTDLPGWEEGASPEVAQYARQLSRVAKQRQLKVRHWIRVTKSIRSNPTKHRAVCTALGYSFGSKVAPWRDGTSNESKIDVLDLPETTLHRREA